MYLAYDHSKVNCAINWDRKPRGSPRICLQNAVGLLSLYHTVFHLVPTLNSSVIESKMLFFMTIFGELHLQVNYRSTAIM